MRKFDQRPRPTRSTREQEHDLPAIAQEVLDAINLNTEDTEMRDALIALEAEEEVLVTDPLYQGGLHTETWLLTPERPPRGSTRAASSQEAEEDADL